LVDEVWMAGDMIVVKNRGQVDGFPISNILNVDTSFFSNPERIVLTLREPSLFGREIVFSPPRRLWPFCRHPIASELIHQIHAMDARESAE
jgi:hypothetical protein